MSDSESQLWDAVKSRAPVEAMVVIVQSWKSAGLGQGEAAERLNHFLGEVSEQGTEEQDDAVREVLDFVSGFCSPDARLF